MRKNEPICQTVCVGLVVYVIFVFVFFCSALVCVFLRVCGHKFFLTIPIHLGDAQKS